MDIPPEMPFLCSEEPCYPYSSTLPVSSASSVTGNEGTMLSHHPPISLPPLVMEPSEHHPWPSNASVLPPVPTVTNNPNQVFPPPPPPPSQPEGNNTVNVPSEHSRPKVAKTASSASLPSHKTKWTSEEDDLLRSGLEMYGYGKWKLISAHVKTRNALQCKNHARHWATTEKRSTSSKAANTQYLTLGNFSDRQPAPPAEDSNRNDGSVVVTAPPPPPPLPQPNVPVAREQHQSPAAVAAFTASFPTHAIFEPSSVREVVDVSHQIIKPEQEEASDSQTQETFIDKNTITEDERKSNPEWFKPGSKASTPERYMKIRNHILECWQAEKPQYVTKTAARRGLRDCGDVNAIGRVHAYLESIGAINVGCQQTKATRGPVKRGIRRSATKFYYYTDDEDEGDNDDGRSNKRRMMDDMDFHKPGAAEGIVRNGISSRRPKRVIKRPQNYLDGASNMDDDNDPFRLVPVEQYHDNFPPPFEVEISANALVVLEFHAHLAYTEIIGLMGGCFIRRDDGYYTLSVSCVFPCRGISTETQCEMDPESEMRAREVFAQKGLNVVGWYHSHPTFAPEPSVRDIEYQTLYQSLFRNEETGAEPFIGIIVSPFNEEYHIQFVHIARKNSKKHVPYECIRTIIPTDLITNEMREQVQALIQEYKDYEHKWDLVQREDDHSSLDQLLSTLTWYLPDTEARKEFLDQVRRMVIDAFGAIKTDETVVKALAV